MKHLRDLKDLTIQKRVIVQRPKKEKRGTLHEPSPPSLVPKRGNFIPNREGWLYYRPAETG